MAPGEARTPYSPPVSNPYDPYGQQPPNPYGGGGGQSFDARGVGGFDQPKTDGVSIAALVTGILCCGIIPLILGIIGLSRTKGGKRKGRGFAIAGLVLGILGTLAGVAAAVFLVVFAQSVVDPEDAEVGQCINVDDDDSDSVVLYKKDCTEDHDGEIVAVVKIDDSNIDQVSEAMVGYCFQAISQEDQAKLQDYDVTDFEAVTEHPDDPEVGDHLVCYIEPGEKLDESIL